MIGFALVALIGISLPGCSSQRDDSQTSDERERVAVTASDRAAIIASDSPSPFHTADTSENMDYDPWESFNEKTFSLNFNYIDHYGLKPAAKVWSDAFPEKVPPPPPPAPTHPPTQPQPANTATHSSLPDAAHAL